MDKNEETKEFPFSGAQPAENKVCYNCNKPGHFSRECPRENLPGCSKSTDRVEKSSLNPVLKSNPIENKENPRLVCESNVTCHDTPNVDDFNFIWKYSLCQPEYKKKTSKYLSFGYIRVLKSDSRVPITAVIDSGNLFNDLMSERLAKLLNLNYKPCVSTAGTAKVNQTMHTLGITDPFDLIVEDLVKPIKIQPYVTCSLSHDLNLGEHFLRRVGAVLKFNGNSVVLEINNQNLELLNRNQLLSKVPTDQRFINHWTVLKFDT